MNDWHAQLYTAIQLHLEATVPLLIVELLEQGGPTEHDYASVRSYGRVIAEHSDALLFREKAVSSQVMDKLVAGIAVLAFCPGGVRVFGLRFDACALAAQRGSHYQDLPRL